MPEHHLPPPPTPPSSPAQANARRSGALAEAVRIAQEAAQAGFDWQDVEGPLAKIEEELAEVREALLAWRAASSARTAAEADGDAAGDYDPSHLAATHAALAGELGDLLFAAINACRLAGIHAGDALQSCNDRFASRFAHMRRQGLPAQARPEAVAQWDRLWQHAKQAERASPKKAKP